ncbi:ADP-ribosyltransferase-containing protein [Aliarcobacter butzleri]|uniref:ADP-ribosyltransferase-containing protein n=1 Tax=Aliarcobacter butzleri TaxID=28197 RepID=UPI00126991F2|nr:hypothetical protein [Aliarcobacter butzleri]
MENESRKQKLSKLALINEQLVSLLPDSFDSKSKLIDWLNINPYSPYITLYGGENALLYNQEKSFISPTDGKNRFILEDEFSFKLENFTSFDNQILSANEPLSKIINCKQLFKNYPEFQNLEININISNANNGYFSGNTLYSNNKANKINIFASNNKEAMRVLLHELQHCIQLKEGFKIGTSYYNEHGVMDLFVGLNKTQSIDEIKNTLSKDTMFSDEVLFKEVFENHEYFNENKDGLKAKLIYLDPYDYVEAVNKVKPKHKHSEDKLQSLKNAYDNGIKVPVPYLTYGSRDEASSDFGQEGYNRAVHATYIGRRTIPVFVRYRENDENIPQAIKNAIDFEKSSFSDIATKKSMVEIDSSKAIINMDILSSSKTRILGDVLNYDTLYTKYPTLYGLKVNVLNIDSHAAYGKNEITISQNLIDKGNVEEIKSSLIHEIQHVIQNIENWARGGSPDEFKNQKELKDLLTQQYEDLQKEIGYEDWQNNLMFNDFDKYCHLLDLGRSNYSLVPFYQEFIKDKKLDKETASYFLFKMDYFNTQIKQIAHSVNPNDYYLRLWGEQQARASQYRLNLSDKEREKENWIGTLQKVEGKYSEPIIKYSESNSFNINIPQHQEIVINHFKNIEKKNLISFLEDKIIDDIKSIQKEKDFYKTFNIEIEDFKNLYPDTKKEIISSLSSYENYADLNHNKIFSDILINVLNDKNENIIEAIKKYENLDVFKESNYDLIAAIKKHGLTINEDNIMLSFVAPKENEIGAFSDIATKTTMVELDSSKSKLHNNISKIIKDDKITTLENILIYDELFNRYPELKNIEVRFVDGSDIEKGSYNRNKNLITINNGISNSDDILSTLLHEVQHVIQNIENWARGGSIKEFEHNLDENTINIMLQNLGEAIFIKEIANKYKCEIENLNFKENTYEYDILKNKNAVRLAKNNSLEWMKKEYENYSTNSEMKYISLWGEQQARAVQFRLKMHLEDRLNENWTETLQKIEGQYKEPIIKYDNIDIANNTLLQNQNNNFQEWFKDSKIVNEDGNPLLLYHGTNSNFDTFDINKCNNGWLGKGFYFTDKKEATKNFGKKRILVHLNMKNPYISNSNSPSDLHSEIKDKFYENKGYLQDIKIEETLKKNGYDGIIYKHWDDENGTFYSVFDSSQIKIVDKQIIIKNAKELKQESSLKEWHKSSSNLTKNKDGSPKVFYHGTKSSFNEFKENKIGESYGNQFGRGFYFTDNSEKANGYGYGEGGNVMPVYLNIQKIADFNDMKQEDLQKFKQELNKVIDINKDAGYGSVRKIDITEYPKEKQYELHDELIEKTDKYWHDRAKVKVIKEDGKIYLSYMEANLENVDGNDILGLLMHKQMLSLVNYLGFDGIKVGDEFIVFEPTQIKSIYNIGTFDKNNPKILEKNDLGLRSLEMIMSIIPNNMNMSSVKEYLFFNNVTHEQLRGTIYNDILTGPKFDASKIRIPNVSSIDFDTVYFQSAGEKESREIESLYIHQDLNNLLAP